MLNVEIAYYCIYIVSLTVFTTLHCAGCCPGHAAGGPRPRPRLRRSCAPSSSSPRTRSSPVTAATTGGYNTIVACYHQLYVVMRQVRGGGGGGWWRRVRRGRAEALPPARGRAAQPPHQHHHPTPPILHIGNTAQHFPGSTTLHYNTLYLYSCFFISLVI